MANTFTQIYIQFVFAVKYREAMLHESWRNQMYNVMGNLFLQDKAKPLIINGVEDHVHCFATLKPVVSISDLMRDVKAKSSKYINDHSLTVKKFEWQEGFGAFSYGQSQVKDVIGYIENQERHHAKQDFLTEYENLLKAFNIEYDEKYIFKKPE